MAYFIVIILVLLSGIFSGLNLGLLSLSKHELERKIGLGDKKAKRIYSVRKRGNLLLCTLLLGNVAVNSTLAIFLGDIASGVMAGIMATGLIVVFGEIIPQATFSRYAVAVGYKTVWLVKILIFVLYPICLPLSWILDRMLGEEMPDIYSKKELMKIVEQHEDLKDSAIDADEERIIRGALSYSDETAIDVMTPRTMLYALTGELKINNSLLKKIKESGFTRIPIYDEVIDDIIGVLYVKDLLGVKKGTRLNKICHHESLMIIKGDIKLDALLNKFIRHKEHIALVKDEFGGTAGIVTLEDIVEEVLRVEIVDETDRVANLQKEAKKSVNNH